MRSFVISILRLSYSSNLMRSERSQLLLFEDGQLAIYENRYFLRLSSTTCSEYMISFVISILRLSYSSNLMRSERSWLLLFEDGQLAIYEISTTSTEYMRSFVTSILRLSYSSKLLRSERS